MKALARIWRRFFASQPIAQAAGPARSQQRHDLQEILGREVRRNLASGMSLREAVRAAEAKARTSS